MIITTNDLAEYGDPAGLRGAANNLADYEKRTTLMTIIWQTTTNDKLSRVREAKSE